MPDAATTSNPSAAPTRPPHAPSAKPVRVLLQQLALPKYRLPVFQELAQRPGIDLQVVYAQYPGLPNAQPAGFKARFVPLKHWRPLGQELLWHAGQFGLISRKHADVAILSWSTRYLSLVPGLLRARLLGIPAIVWGHGYSKHEHRWTFFARKLVARLAKAVVFYAQGPADRFAASGFDRSRVFVAANSLDQTPIIASRDYWKTHPDELAAFQREKDIEGRDCVIYISRLDPANRVATLVKAADVLRKTNPALLVLIIGSGEDGPAIQKLIAERGLSNHVRTLGSIYDERIVGAYCVSSKAFCYPRNIGLSILHAFGYALPVVTGDHLPSHNPEIEAFAHNANGLFFKDGDEASLADTLRRLLTDEPLRQRLAHGAAKTVAEQFSVPRMVDGFEAAIRHCLK